MVLFLYFCCRVHLANPLLLSTFLFVILTLGKLYFLCFVLFLEKLFELILLLTPFTSFFILFIPNQTKINNVPSEDSREIKPTYVFH